MKDRLTMKFKAIDQPGCLFSFYPIISCVWCKYYILLIKAREVEIYSFCISLLEVLILVGIDGLEIPITTLSN